MKARTPALGFVFVTLLLDVLGFGLLIPVGPHLVQQLTGGTEQEAAPIVGWLMATYSAMQFLFAPVLGTLSDRFGRRPVLLFALLGSGLDYFAMALAPNIAWLFVTRALNGLTGASMTVASAYIADVTPPERRAAGYAVVGAAFGIGFVLGPLSGGLLGEIDIRLPFWVAGGVTLLNWLFGLLVVPESLPPERRNRSALRKNPLSTLGILRGHPFVLRMAMSLFLLNAAQFALHATWVLYTGYRYGWDEGDVGWSLCAVGLGAAVVQGGLTRRIVPRLGERRSLALGVLCGVLAYVGYALATEGWMIYAAIAVASLGGIAMPACQALITKSVRADEQGAVQGALMGMQNLANIAGPLMGGYLFEWSIAVQPPLPGAVFFGSAILGGLGWLVAVHALRRSHAAA